MRLSEAIRRADELKPNRFSSKRKEEWINALQRKIYDQVISTRQGAELYEFEKADIEGESSIPVKYVTDGNCIVVSQGPETAPYPIVGQRIFAGDDYFTVLDTDYTFNPFDELWGIYVAGPVTEDITHIYPASTVFLKGSDELIVSGAYEDIYVHWLFTKIDFFNRETAGYNNSVLVFNEIFDDYLKSVIRGTAPLPDRKIVSSR